MHTLRTHTALARLILAWFALTLGAAIASPLVSPKALQLVCSVGAAAKWVVVDAGGDAAPVGQHTLDCPLCLLAAPPSPWAAERAVQPLPPTGAPHPLVAGHTAAPIGAPLPPRGPPFKG